MKDFYDIWSLASHFAFDGPILSEAIRATFYHRHTTLQVSPVAFTAGFVDNRDKQAQWRAFIRRHQFSQEPPTLAEAVQVIAALLQPVVLALIEGFPFNQHWPPGGPWQEVSDFGSMEV